MKLLLVFLFFMQLFESRGQVLKIGETVPDLELFQVLNNKSESIRLTDLRGKLVILDFWSQTCLSCIAAFPKLDSLQHEFGDKIQIILVSHETQESAKSFFERRKQIKKPSIPMITSDTILSKMFPHTGVPHHIWIDTRGVFTYSTYSFYTTSGNIKKFLDGANLAFSELKRSVYLESLFDKRIDKPPAYYSYIGYCINEGSVHLNGPKNTQNSVASGICLSAMELFQMAYNESPDVIYYKYGRPGRTILKVTDRYKYQRPDDPDKLQYWISNYSYYYQLVLPPGNNKNKYRIMKDDLNRFFNITAKVVKQEIDCFVLERTSKVDKLKTKGGVQKNTFMRRDDRNPEIDSVREVRNMPFDVFSERLQRFIEITLNHPVCDNTNYTGNIDIKMTGEVVDSLTINSLNEQLKKYDLQLLKKSVEMDVLLLADSY